jgi:hypothetical protein
LSSPLLLYHERRALSCSLPFSLKLSSVLTTINVTAALSTLQGIISLAAISARSLWRSIQTNPK